MKLFVGYGFVTDSGRTGFGNCVVDAGGEPETMKEVLELAGALWPYAEARVMNERQEGLRDPPVVLSWKVFER